MALEERVSKLEGINQQILERLNSLEAQNNARFNSLEAHLDARFNTQMVVFVGMWVTTMAFTLATLVAVLLRT